LEKLGFFEVIFEGMWVFGVKTGFGKLICRVWVKQAKKTFKNV